MVIIGKLPVPLGVKPVTLPELATPVQVKDVPPKLAVHGTAAVATPEQRVWAIGVLTIPGVGEIVTTKLLVVPTHPL
jgi:hypothetical protein